MIDNIRSNILHKEYFYFWYLEYFKLKGLYLY